MSGHAYTVSVKRHVAVHKLELANQTTSQWLDASEYRSAFCIAQSSTPAGWIIEVLLPSGNVATVGSYETEDLFSTTRPRYITVNAMCGLPIRFTSSEPQSNPQLWVVFKS